MTVALITASLPERRAMLSEAVASVAAQSTLPDVHLVGVDHRREGAAVVYNRLAAAVDTEWVTFLDDDDLIDSDHLAFLIGAAGDDVDVVYNGCRCVGPHDFTTYNTPFDADLLRERNCVPITALVRRSLFERAGGFRTEWGYDWLLWCRILEAGGRFFSTGAVTWTYRRHGANQSYGELG